MKFVEEAKRLEEEGLWEKGHDETGIPGSGSNNDPAQTPEGGIDFNPQLFDLEDQGMDADMDVFDNASFPPDLQIEGIVPVIINVTPVTNLPQLLGYEDESSEGSDLQLSYLNEV